jgi:hypothetical protein
MGDPSGKQMMERVAKTYDQLAASAEKWRGTSRQSSD